MAASRPFPRPGCPRPSTRAHLQSLRGPDSPAHAKRSLTAITAAPPAGCRMTDAEPNPENKLFVGGAPRPAPAPGLVGSVRARPTPARPLLRAGCPPGSPRLTCGWAPPPSAASSTPAAAAGDRARRTADAARTPRRCHALPADFAPHGQVEEIFTARGGGARDGVRVRAVHDPPMAQRAIENIHGRSRWRMRRSPSLSDG